MSISLEQKLRAYVDAFNAQDEELYAPLIPNSAAADFLLGQIPLLDCPDETLERAYYFRWWTLRKHFRETPMGHVITEFLPPVPWAGPYNTIVCPAGHQLRETRWLRDADGWVTEYIDFWLGGHGQEMAYSTWLATAVWDYCQGRGIAPRPAWVDALAALYRRWEGKALGACGLFWSNDGRDGMEYSISGPGYRPTLNSYLCSDAAAIAKMAQALGQEALAREYAEKSAALKERINQLLWAGDFYKTIPAPINNSEAWTSRPAVASKHDVRELAGYLPWAYGVAVPGRAEAFRQLLTPEGFAAPFGPTTAERRHPRFMEHHDHECLWNGPSWPFATSQLLTACAKLLRSGEAQSAFTWTDYRRLLGQYAAAHTIRRPDGTVQSWIDEDLDPFDGHWIARDELAARGGPGQPYERGKDYNHSTFCDLVLSGLLGIAPDGRGGLTADPHLPPAWDNCRVEHLWYGGRFWRFQYDRAGWKMEPEN